MITFRPKILLYGLLLIALTAHSGTSKPNTQVPSKGTGSTGMALEDEPALRVNSHLAYWFGWFAFFPNTLVYGSELGEG